METLIQMFLNFREYWRNIFIPVEKEEEEEWFLLGDILTFQSSVSTKKKRKTEKV